VRRLDRSAADLSPLAGLFVQLRRARALLPLWHRRATTPIIINRVIYPSVAKAGRGESPFARNWHQCQQPARRVTLDPERSHHEANDNSEGQSGDGGNHGPNRYVTVGGNRAMSHEPQFCRIAKRVKVAAEILRIIQ
jgi:hypothetical protein